jgi:hypothetical protein
VHAHVGIRQRAGGDHRACESVVQIQRSYGGRSGEAGSIVRILLSYYATTLSSVSCWIHRYTLELLGFLASVLANIPFGTHSLLARQRPHIAPTHMPLPAEDDQPIRVIEKINRFINNQVSVFKPLFCISCFDATLSLRAILSKLPWVIRCTSNYP